MITIENNERTIDIADILDDILLLIEIVLEVFLQRGIILIINFSSTYILYLSV